MICRCDYTRGQACARCDAALSAYEDYREHGPLYDERDADAEADRYENAIYAALGA